MRDWTVARFIHPHDLSFLPAVLPPPAPPLLLMLAPPLPLCASRRDAGELSLPPFHPFSYRAVPRDLRTTRVRVGGDGGGFWRAKRLPPPYSSPSRCSATSMDAGDTPRGRWGPSLDLSLLLFLLLLLLLPQDRTLLYLLLLLLLLTSSGLDLMDAVVVRVPVSPQGQISSLLE